MALTYGFYNSVEGDRTYDAIQFGSIFDGIIKDGVYGTYLEGLKVTSSSDSDPDINVIIHPGRAWFNHTWSYNDANEVIEAETPDSSLDRIDALVLDIDTSLAVRENKFKWVKGKASSKPVRPTLAHTATHNQYALCYVHRYPQTTPSRDPFVVRTADITNVIGTSETPFATGVLEGIDLDAWINQWDDEFHTWENATVTSFEQWMINQQTVYTTWFTTIRNQMEGDMTDFESWFETIQGIIDEEAATHLQSEIDALAAMLPAGSHITVTTNEQSLYLRNVTVSDVAGHSATAKFDNTGVAVIESFPYIGSLTVTATDGTPAGTATEILPAPYFGRYNVNLAFWSATINLNGDSSVGGVVVKVKDHTGTQLSTVTLNASGKGVYSAAFPDTYTFEYTIGGDTMEVSLNVTEETTYSVEIYAGFNWRTWCTLGGVSTYGMTSLQDVFDDEVAVRRLMTVHASSDYLIDRVSHKLSDIDEFTVNDTAMKWIGLRDYVCDGLTAIDGVWAKFMASDYWERILKDHVPVMASSTAPYGTPAITGGTQDSSYPAWKAFDGDDSTLARVTSAVKNRQIQYKFTAPIMVKKFKFRLAGMTSGTITITLQHSDDGTDWVSDTDAIPYTNATTVIHSTDNTKAHIYWRIAVTTSTAYQTVAHTVQFYGRSLNVSVPAMTSNTAPYGTAGSSTPYSSAYAAWKAFNGDHATYWSSQQSQVTNQWISYAFTKPICLKGLYLKNRDAANNTFNPKNCKIQYSDNGESWSDLKAFVATQGQNAVTFVDSTDNVISARYWRMFMIDSNFTDYIYICTLQFYGVDYSEREFEEGSTIKYLYDHGVEFESATPVTVGGDAVATKNENNLVVQVPGNTNRFAGFVFPSIDLTAYSLMRGVFDDIGNSTGVMLWFTIENTSTPSYNTTPVASTGFSSSDGVIPNNLSLNISSVNQNGYPSISTYNVSGTSARKGSANELWLE